MDTTDSEQELKGLKRAKSLLAQTLIGFDNAEKDYGYDMANERYYVEQAIHEIDNDVNETSEGNGESSPLEGIVRCMSDDLIEELKRTKNLRNSDDERLVEAGKAMMPKEGQEYWIRLECENAELLQAVFNSMFKNKDGSSSYVFGAKLEEIFFGSPKQKFIRDYLQQKLNEID